MLLQKVINSNGPLPISGAFNAESDSEAVIMVSGSAWSSQPNQWVGAVVLLDGNIVGEVVVYCNEASSHRALIPALIPATLSFGQHTIELQAVSTYTQCDQNDFLTAYVMY